MHCAVTSGRWASIFGRHLAVVLSVSALNFQLGHVVVTPITGTEGPAYTHVPVTSEAGLAKYAVSYIDITVLMAVDRFDLVRHRGRLAPAELHRVAALLRTYLGLQ